MKPKYHQPQSETLKESIYATVLVFMLGLFTNDDHKLQKYVPKRPSPKKESYFEGIRAELGKHEFLMPLKNTGFENHPKALISFFA